MTVAASAWAIDCRQVGGITKLVHLILADNVGGYNEDEVIVDDEWLADACGITIDEAVEALRELRAKRLITKLGPMEDGQVLYEFFVGEPDYTQYLQPEVDR